VDITQDGTGQADFKKLENVFKHLEEETVNKDI